MQQDINLTLQQREVLQKGLNQLRDQGKIPAVIHDHGKPSLHVLGDYINVVKTFRQAGKSHPINATIGNKKRLVLIKDVDYHPVKNNIRHIVFQSVKQNEETEAEIPVVFKEDVEIPAEKASLMVLKQLDHVQVRALPKDLPHQLEVDPSTLAEVGDHVTVADLKLPAGVTLVTDPDLSLAAVEVPKDQIAEADAALEEQKAAEEAQAAATEEETGAEDKTAGETETETADTNEAESANGGE